MEWWSELQARWQEAFGANAPWLGNLLLALLVTGAAWLAYRGVRVGRRGDPDRGPARPAGRER